MSRRQRKIDRTPSIAVSYYRISELRLDPKNPRNHDRLQIRKIARSIEAFGFNVPVLIDAKRNVIAGHGRLLACRELGMDDVPAIRLEHLTDAQARAFKIADNRLTEIGTWDDQLLGEQLQMLAAVDLDFSLEVTGFEMGEIDLRIEGLKDVQKNKADPADILPAPSPSPPVTKPGDLWALGRHRLFCGNAVEPLSYERLLDTEQVAMIFTDPPYNVKIDGHASGLGNVRHRDFAMGSGEMSRSEFTGFLTKFCVLAATHSTQGAIHFICMDWRHAEELLAAGRRAYSELKNVCVWVKHNAGMGSLYRSQHELVFVFKNGRAPHRNNVQLGKHGRHRSNVWSYRGANDFGRPTDEGQISRIHPTVKPVQMVADAILDCTKRGDIILDPFMGSGTTLIAAERTGRCCYGIELDAAYADAIIRRWQAFTGDQAMREPNGNAFAELERNARCKKGRKITRSAMVNPQREPNSKKENLGIQQAARKRNQRRFLPT